MLQRLFTSRTRTKLLKLFFLDRKREFYLRELARITGENPNSVGRELKNLSEGGIVTERKKGNQKLYAANESLPIHEDLRRLVLKTLGFGEVLSGELSKLGKIKFCIVYGSFAIGDEVSESDLDILIIGDLDEEKLIEVVRGLEEELSRDINYILWTAKEFKNKSRQGHHLLLDIVEKPVIMIVGDEDEFRKTVEGQNHPKSKNRQRAGKKNF
ncbi:hypothetical protein A3K63_04425 [Candidatus Micrarchaeota archaeon RBG_16_49_10]|nr:MAG: hypothetical protein A3K63_04425 [Candidatus Micrarchaeota archaeon RBG_16_49_10]